MTELVAWVVFPLAALLACLGSGLLAERLARVSLPAALVAPLGFAAATCAVGYVYILGLGAWWATGIVAAAAAAGLALARHDLRVRFRPGPAAAGGAAVYALYMAPVVLSGDATFLGYNFLNDTAIHLMLVDYVSEFGRDDPAGLPESSFKSAALGYIGLDYPVGSHELLATVRQPLGIDVAHVYQPYLAFAGGIAASALYAALRRAAVPAAAAAGASVVALASQLLFSFNLQGGIKELTFLACLAAAVALGAELLAGKPAGRTAALAAIPLAAGYAIYSWAALAWAGTFALVLLALALRSRESGSRRALLPAAGIGAGVFVAACLPTLVQSISFADNSQDVLTADTELGPLLKPLKPLQVAGVWLTGDYRMGGGALVYVLAGLVCAFALLGAVFAFRRRAAPPLLLGLPALVAWLVIRVQGSPYAESKAMAIASPAVLLLACAGMAALWSSRSLRAPAAVAAAGLVALLALGDARAYREARLAPMDRLEELDDLGERFAGEGPVLVNEFEEYAKHFARDARPVSPYEQWTPAPAAVNVPNAPRYGQAYDLDQLTLEYVERWPLIATRLSPAASRPPRNYERVWSGDFYEVWRRNGTGPAVHVPGGIPPDQPAGGANCDALPELAGSERITGAAREPIALAGLPGDSPLPRGWDAGRAAPPLPLRLTTRDAGTVSAPATTEAGPHDVWVQGSFQRESDVLVDGRKVGVASGVNGPNQWVRVGRVELDAGEHEVELRRPAGSLAPGDKAPDRIGPAALVPLGETRLLDGARACSSPIDWVEGSPP